MTSLKQGYLHTHIIEKSEKIKMSTRNSMDYNEEEEQMVARVWVRGRSLVQALIRVRRERAGRAPQNLQVIQDSGMRPQIQEMGPHGQEVERRSGGLQARGRRNQTIDRAPETDDTNDRQQTVPNDRLRTRVRARARPNTPLLHPDFPIVSYMTLLLWDALWPPTYALIAKMFLMIYSPCHPTPLMTPTLCPIMRTYFPLAIPHSLTLALPYGPLL